MAAGSSANRNHGRLEAAAGEAAEIEIEVFFDGDCPLCQREIACLRRLDRRERIQFTNIAATEFIVPPGRTFDQLMAEIQGRLPDGTWVSGVEVLRRLYAAVGCRWLVMPTRLPGISQMLDWGYRIFARNRLRLTGRCNDACRLPVLPGPPVSR